MNTVLLAIGLMSGTSMDGIDAVLLRTDGEGIVEEIASISLDYDDATKKRLKSAEKKIRETYSHSGTHPESYEIPGQARDDEGAWDDDGARDDVTRLSTDLHIQAVEKLLTKSGYKAEDIDVIGYHGQTMYHNPEAKISIILGDGALMAKTLGITVVNDFRRNDIDHGGKGAPFAPIYHMALAKRDHKIPLAIVNCGGIANITLISSDNPDDIIAFDTGPGNGLIDKLVRERTDGKEHMDANGKYGSKGGVHEDVLKILYEKSIIKDNKNFFTTLPPKSLDIGDMILPSAINDLSMEDACRTLEAFTADSIIKSLELTSTKTPKNWILAGGGWYNPVILSELKTRLKAKNMVAETADEGGWNSKALEAQIFAYLAVRSLRGLPLSFPGTTGVPKPMTGGVMWEK